ncbi:hypothetical protein V8C35DRAFT_280571 [Trichoderma chlorosporum]
MKHATVLFLFHVLSLIECATAAVRSEILYRNHRRRGFQFNTSIEIVQHGLSTAGVTSSELADSTTKQDVLSTSETASEPTTDSISGSLSSIFSVSRSVLMTGAEIDDTGRITSPPATDDIPTTEDPSRESISIATSTTTSITHCGNGDASDCSPVVPTTEGKLIIPLPTSSSPLPSTTSIEPCTPLPSGKAITEYSIVYTSTVTYYGSSIDYTPPYSPIITPNYCSPAGEALITFFSTTRVSNSTSTLTVLALSSATPSYDPFIHDPVPIPLPTFSIDLPETITQTPDAAGKGGGEVIITMRPFLSFSRFVVTFITTDKNPSVVFSPEPTPAFGQTMVTGNVGDGHHKTIEAVDDSQSNSITTDTVKSVKQLPVPTFQLTAGGEQVVIGSVTVSDLKPGQTTTVTVRDEVFTILPTAVVGLGSTVPKPAPQATYPLPAETSGILGGIPVVISGTQVVVDGTTMNIPPQKTTTSISGQRVVLGAGTIAVGRQTLILPPPQPPHEIVTGGEMITAIGTSLVVLHSTTIKYGLNIPPDQTVINGETVSIGPRGISLHGTTIGGLSADAKATEYEIVGGVTVGKILPSLVVVNGATYAINQGGDPNNLETTVIDGQTITIGPGGLVVSSQTLSYPGSSVTATLSASRALIPDLPVETSGHGNREDDDESGALSSRQRWAISVTMCFCFVTSFWVLA